MLTILQEKVGLFLLFRIAKLTGFDIQPCHKSWKAIKAHEFGGKIYREIVR